MKLQASIETALNRQINHEMAAAYSYLAMEAWFEQQNLAGFATWMRVQREEELEHARLIFSYVHDRGGKVTLGAVDGPQGEFGSPREVFARASELERGNTKAIHEVYELALKEKDYATQSMLKWFIDEQVEEEKTTTEIEALLDMAGDNRSALLLLDAKLGSRGTGEG